MTERGPKSGAPLPGEGLAGGPGPTPPGLDDGTPKPIEGSGGGVSAVEPEPGRSARDAEPGRGTVPRGDPEEPDPS